MSLLYRYSIEVLELLEDIGFAGIETDYNSRYAIHLKIEWIRLEILRTR